MSDDTEEIFIQTSVKQTERLLNEGHDPGEWTWSEYLKSYKTTCHKCRGTVTIIGGGERGRGKKDGRIWLIGHDMFTSLDSCPGDDPELMKRLNDEWARRMAEVVRLLIQLGRENREKADLADSSLTGN